MTCVCKRRGLLIGLGARLLPSPLLTVVSPQSLISAPSPLLTVCSATWPREVKQIASQFVTNMTVHVFIGGVEDRLVANKAITQNVKVRERLADSHLAMQITSSSSP